MCDFPKLVLAAVGHSTLENRRKREKDRGAGREKSGKKQREKIYARGMKKTEEVSKEVDVVSLVFFLYAVKLRLRREGRKGGRKEEEGRNPNPRSSLWSCLPPICSPPSFRVCQSMLFFCFFFRK